MKKKSWFFLIILSAVLSFVVQNANAVDGNIFAGFDSALEDSDFDFAIENIVSGALNQGMNVSDILSMAMDEDLEGLGLNNRDIIVSTIIALLRSPNLTPEEIALAAKNLMIPDEYLQLIKGGVGSGEDVIDTRSKIPAPTGPGFSGVHPPPERVASPSRP